MVSRAKFPAASTEYLLSFDSIAAAALVIHNTVGLRAIATPQGFGAWMAMPSSQLLQLRYLLANQVAENR